MCARLALACLVAALALPGAARAADWTALVVNDVAGTVSPVDTRTDVAASALNVGALPLGVAISPDARTAYVVDLGATAGTGAVSVIDLTRSAPRVTATVPITAGTPNFIAIAPNGAQAYVSDPGNGTVVPLDLTRSPPRAGTPFSAGAQPEGIAFTPDGRKAYVADLAGDAVIPVDTATDSPRAPIPLPNRGPFALAVMPDGRTVYAADLSGSAVTPIDTATDSAGADIQVGARPQGIAITPDGTTALVASGATGTVTPIALATGTAGTPVAVGDDPYAVAITPDGRRAYVSNGGAGDSTIVPLSVGPDGRDSRQPDCRGQRAARNGHHTRPGAGRLVQRRQRAARHPDALRRELVDGRVRLDRELPLVVRRRQPGADDIRAARDARLRRRRRVRGHADRDDRRRDLHHERLHRPDRRAQRFAGRRHTPYRGDRSHAVARRRRARDGRDRQRHGARAAAGHSIVRGRRAWSPAAGWDDRRRAPRHDPPDRHERRAPLFGDLLRGPVPDRPAQGPRSDHRPDARRGQLRGLPARRPRGGAEEALDPPPVGRRPRPVQDGRPFQLGRDQGHALAD